MLLTSQGIKKNDKPPYKSLPPKFRPLPQRINAVLTTNPSLDMPKNISITTGLQEAIDTVKEQAKTQHKKTLHKVFISGEKVYYEALSHTTCKQLYITHIYLAKGHQTDLQVDTFFPSINESVYKLEEQGKRQKPSKSNPPRIKFMFEHYSHRGTTVQ
jgi:dihydrofolate reductase